MIDEAWRLGGPYGRGSSHQEVTTWRASAQVKT
jgi:hypothetical protein